MLNFYAVSDGSDMVNDTDRSTTCRYKFRAPPLQRKVLPKTRVSPNNRLNNSDQKLKTCTFGIREQNKETTKLEKQQLKEDLVTRKKETKIILREAFRLKLSKLLQDSNYSGRKMINFFLLLFGRGIFNDTTNAATFRPGLQSRQFSHTFEEIYS